MSDLGQVKTSEEAEKPWRPLAIYPLVMANERVFRLIRLRQKLISLRYLDSPEKNYAAALILMATEGGLGDDGLEYFVKNMDLYGCCCAGAIYTKVEREHGIKAAAFFIPLTAEFYLQVAWRQSLGGLRLFGEKRPLRSCRYAESSLHELEADINEPGEIGHSLSWAQVLRIAPALALTAGIPPLMLTVHRQAPTSEHADNNRPLSGPTFSASHHIKAISHAVRSAAWPHRSSDEVSKREAAAEIEGVQLSRNTRKCFISVSKRYIEALRDVSGGKFLSDQARAKAQDVRVSFLAEADKLCGPYSALHLLIRWGFHRLNNGRFPRAKKIKEYAGILFHAAFFMSEQGGDLREWDEDDLLAIGEEIVDRGNTDATRTEYHNLVRDLFKFASKNGFCTNVAVTYVDLALGESVRRANILRLCEGDALIRELWALPIRGGRLAAICVCLALYGAMRPGEILALRLRDIEIADGEINVFIRGGKTPAARRYVPFHLLAPQWICGLIEEFWSQRIREISGSQRRLKYSFVGPAEGSRRMTRQEIIEPITSILKNALGPNYVFYSLRHTCASFWMIRLFALRYPHISSSLVDSNHEVFSFEMMKKFRKLVGYGEYLPATLPSTGLIAIAKIMGHSGFSTLLTRYVHTWSLIQREVQRSVDQNWTEQKLPRLLCSKIWGVSESASASLARLPKTLSATVDRFRLDAVTSSRHRHKPTQKNRVLPRS